jgi:hypothetical protein
MSSDLVQFPPAPPTRQIYLIGFRLDPGAEQPQFYTLMGDEGESERPITREGRILFFRHPKDARKALKESDNGFADLARVPHEMEMLCDVSSALYVANAEESDEEGVLFELIAVFDDLLRAIRMNVPEEHAGLLGAVAQRLAQNPEFVSVLESRKATRDKLEDALLWCVGAVAVKSSFVE